MFRWCPVRKTAFCKKDLHVGDHVKIFGLTGSPSKKYNDLVGCIQLIHEDGRCVVNVPDCDLKPVVKPLNLRKVSTTFLNPRPSATNQAVAPKSAGQGPAVQHNTKAATPANPLMDAIASRDSKRTMEVLETIDSASLNQVNSHGQTVLVCAVENNLVDIATALLRTNHFTKVNQQDNSGQTVLHVAALSGLSSVVVPLFGKESFSAVNVQDQEGRTALHSAAQRGNCYIMEAILNKIDSTKANEADHVQWTALHVAAFQGNEAACKLLLEHNKFTAADAKDQQGRTALDIAIQNESRHPKYSGTASVLRQ